MVPSNLIELGQQAIATVTTNVRDGAPLVRCQLLASEFYEALKRELRATSQLGVIERGIVAAAANHCRHAANTSISPGVMLGELRSALAFLEYSPPVVPPTRSRPVLRVIQGGAF